MNKVIGLTLVWAFICLCASSGLCEEELSAEQYAARAVQSVKDGNQAGALADFNKAIELAPDKPIHYRNRAAFFALTKQWDKAIADYDMVLKVDKTDPATPLNR